ncbi:MAG: hypothetical protein ACSHYA_04085 [Opitutaceae bacterium]
MVYLETHNPHRKVVIDLSDQQRIIIPQALDECDFYFKRSFDPKGYESSKVKPYGLYYATTSPVEYDLITRTICSNSNRRIWLKKPRQAVRNLKSALQLKNKIIQESPEAPYLTGEQKVFFQTRLFRPQKQAERNEERIAFVKALKRELGDAFVGGIVDCPNSRNYKLGNLISEHRSDQKTYLNLIQNSAICISTTGVYLSTPCKISEYLKLGRCILSNPIHDKLPQPLVEGTHINSFRTIEECIKKSTQLLNDPKRVREMQLNGFNYYNEHASPEVAVRRLLKLATS